MSTKKLKKIKSTGYEIILIYMSLIQRDLNIYKPNKQNHTNCKNSFDKGEKIVFTPLCTCEGCLLVERWYLKRGETFTVKNIFEKNGWLTVELEEVPDKFFSCSMFSKNKSCIF